MSQERHILVKFSYTPLVCLLVEERLHSSSESEVMSPSCEFQISSGDKHLATLRRFFRRRPRPFQQLWSGLLLDRTSSVPRNSVAGEIRSVEALMETPHPPASKLLDSFTHSKQLNGPIRRLCPTSIVVDTSLTLKTVGQDRCEPNA